MSALNEFVRAVAEFRKRTNGKDPRRIAISQSFYYAVIDEGHATDILPLTSALEGPLLLMGHAVEVRPYPPIPYFIFWD